MAMNCGESLQLNLIYHYNYEFFTVKTDIRVSLFSVTIPVLRSKVIIPPLLLNALK